jgi:hypothetical protein
VLNNKTAAAEAFSPLSDGMHIPLVSTTLPSACELTTNLVGNNAQADIVGRTWLHVSCPRSELAKTRAELSSVLNFIVYRQARKPDGSVSPLMQSSPLIDIAHFSTFTRTGKDDPIPWLYLNDPFIWAYTDFFYTPNIPTQTTFAYVDRSGLVDGWDYRYQIVFFGENQSLQSWRMSPWTKFTSPVNSVEVLFQLESEL